MRPPYCAFCDTFIETPEAGDLVQFSDYAPLPDDMTGHPEGLEWFCREHLPAAAALSHLTLGEALRALQGRAGSS